MRALEGIEVVSLAVNVPGPIAAARLAVEGARVTKVEPPEGDPLSLHVPSWYARLTGSQTVVRLDLKSVEGKRALASLLGGADLLLTSNRPRTLERLRLDFPALHGRYPRLCQLQIIGFQPPDDDLPAHDLSFQAAAGLVVDPPHLPFTLLADLMGAERAVAEAMAMLLVRERTGDATCRQVALADAAASLATPIELGMCGPKSPLGGAHPGYALYATEDGWIALAALEPRFMRMLEEALGFAPTADRLRDVFQKKSGAHWEAWGRQHGIPITRLR